MVATSVEFCQLPLQKNISSCLSQIQEATLALLEAASELSLIQKSIGKIEFTRELKQYQQNPKDIKEYLDLVQKYSECDLEEISALGILSLRKLAYPSNTPVREALESLPEVTPSQVDDLTKTLGKKQRKPKQLKDNIWGEGGIFFNTGDIYDHPEAGVALERMVASEGKTPQTITAQSIELRQEVVRVLETQASMTDIALQASVVEEDDSSLSITLDSTLPKINFQGREFILLDATKKCVLEINQPIPISIQPSIASLESLERQRTLQNITQYQAYLSMEQSPLRTPLSELSSIELKAVEVLLEAAIGQADWNQIQDAISWVQLALRERQNRTRSQR
ncbi:hypothetical protein [Scytonema sp. NUACC26]|uniref:hypothetical protein n=1 Tax=Scytonema sp. NUACC26 TaxID=3140176 RepID=UPI0038B2BFCB